MEIPKEIKQYISGFFDGDGSINIEKQKRGYTLRIKFCQSNLDLINKLNIYYPYLTIYGKQRVSTHRCEYELRGAGEKIEPLINDLLEHAILKYEQLLEAKQFFKYINKKNTTDEKETIYNNLKLLKITSKNKPYYRLCTAYIAGLFDAEGSIGIYNKTLRVKITQKSDIEILNKIAEIYNNDNKIDNYAIAFYGLNSKKFLEDVKTYCIYKKPQIYWALNYISTIGKTLNSDIIDFRQICIKVLKEEKLKN